jgi:hypothetical protein
VRQRSNKGATRHEILTKSQYISPIRFINLYDFFLNLLGVLVGYRKQSLVLGTTFFAKAFDCAIDCCVPLVCFRPSEPTRKPYISVRFGVVFINLYLRANNSVADHCLLY